jgi:hypothetical protein
MFWLAEDDCVAAQGEASRNFKIGCLPLLVRPYNLVRMRNLMAATIPAQEVRAVVSLNGAETPIWDARQLEN